MHIVTKAYGFLFVVVTSLGAMQPVHAVDTSDIPDPTPVHGKLANTMNYDACLNYSMKPCVRVCPTLLGPRPAVGIEPKYQEPTSLVETSCLRGDTELGKSGGFNFIGAMLSGSMLNKAQDQGCVSGVRSPGYKTTRHFNEAHVFGFSGPTRYLSSGDPMQVTQSLTCGIAGSAGMFMDFSNMFDGFKNFSLGNIGDQLGQIPQQITQGIQNSIQDLSGIIQKLPQELNNFVQDIPNMVTDAVQGVESMISDAAGSLSGLGDALSNFGDIGSSLSGLSGELQGMGKDVLANTLSGIAEPLSQLGNLGGLDMSTLTDLQNLDIGSLTQYASSLGGELSAIPGMKDMGLSLQNLGGITTSGWQNAIGNAKLALVAKGGGQIALPSGRHSLARKLAADTGRQSVSNRTVRTAQYGSTAVTGDEEPLISSYFAPIGDVPEVTSVRGKMHPTGRFLNSGNSQIAAEMLEREYKIKQEYIAFYGAESGRLAKLIASQGGISSDVCAFKASLEEGKKELETRRKEVISDGIEIYVKGSYLPLEFSQGNNIGGESSCIKTHAGYQVTPKLSTGMGTERRDNINCFQQCGQDLQTSGSSDTGCQMLPNPGFKGSCSGNRLSQFEVDGRYPACADDRKWLNKSRENAFLQTLKMSLGQIHQAEQAVKRYTEQNNISCDISEKNTLIPTKVAAHSNMLMATAPLVGAGLSEQDVVSSPARTAGLLGGGMGDSGLQLEVTEFGGLTKWLNNISAFTRKGGVRQAANNMIGKRLPFGLFPAFLSEGTEWSKPSGFNLIGQIKTAIGSTMQSTLAPFTCLAPSHAADYGIVNSGALAKLNSIVDCTTWGPKYPVTGWSHHKDPAKAAANVGVVRGHSEALNFGAITANTKGTQQFNMDYPFVKGGGKHRGSGCYNVGTGKSLHGLNLLKPDFKKIGTDTTEVNDGKHIFTTWKNTSCCIYFCSGVTGLFPKPKVDRLY